MLNDRRTNHPRRRPPAALLHIAMVLGALVIGLGAASADSSLLTQQHAGRTLLADLMHADGKAKDVPIVLMVHGTFAHKDMELMQALQTALGERELHSLAITLSFGVDQRKGQRDCKQPITDTYGDGRAEIDTWVQRLANEGYKNIILLGHSRGGARVAEYLTLHGDNERIRAAVLLAPATEQPGRFEREYSESFSDAEMTAFKAKLAAAKDSEIFALPKFLYCSGARASAAAVRSYYGPAQIRDAIAFLQKLEQTRVLVVAAGADEVITDLPERMSSLKNAKNVSFETVAESGHLFLDFYTEDAADLVAAFAEKTTTN